MTRLLWIAAFLLFATTCVGLWVAGAWMDRDHALEQAESQAMLTTRLLEEHAERAIEAGGALVRSLASQAAGLDLSDPASKRHLHDHMAEAVQASRQIGSTWLLDEEGTLVLASRFSTVEPADYSYREYYRVHRDGSRQLYIGPPDRGSLRGTNRFTLSRPILDPAGAFAGVVVAGVYIDYFERFYEEAQPAPGATIQLFNEQGVLLAAWPLTGEGAVNDEPDDTVAGLAAGEARATQTDNAIRLLRHLPTLPLVVATTVPLTAALDAWQDRALLSSVVPAVAILGFGLLMVLGLRGAARLEDANESLEARVAERTAALSSSEALARERYEELEALYRDAPVGLALFDRTLACRRANATMAEICGAGPNELRKDGCHELLAACGLAEALQCVLDGGRPILDAELRRRLPGQPGVERIWRGSHYPVFGPDGQVVAVGTVLHEVTGEVRAAEAVRESESELRLVADALPALVAFIDADRRYRFVNRGYAEWAGRKPEEIERRTVEEALAPETYAKLAAQVETVLRGEQVREELPLRDHLGRERQLDLQYLPRLDGKRVAGFYLFAADVTERKAAERRQRLLMAELDHRVRNILATIQSMIALTETATETKVEFARAIRGRVAAMARTQARLTRQNWKGAELREILHDELSAYAPDEGHLSIEVPDSLLLPPREALNFALVVHELATNASKYGALSAPGGRIRVQATLAPGTEGPLLEVEWRESGGPALEAVRRKGFGSRLITGALGSGAEVALEFPRDGAVCRIRLPLPAAAAGPGAPEQAGGRAEPPPAREAPGAQRDLAGLRVLIVEDEALLAMELERQLDELGATAVGPASSLPAAESLAERGGFDVALLDLNLQGLSSEPLAERLLLQQVPFAFLTGYQATAVLPEHLHRVPFLQKPVSADALRRQLCELVQQNAGARTERLEST